MRRLKRNQASHGRKTISEKSKIRPRESDTVRQFCHLIEETQQFRQFSRRGVDISGEKAAPPSQTVSQHVLRPLYAPPIMRDISSVLIMHPREIRVESKSGDNYGLFNQCLSHDYDGNH